MVVVFSVFEHAVCLYVSEQIILFGQLEEVLARLLPGVEVHHPSLKPELDDLLLLTSLDVTRENGTVQWRLPT